MKNKDIQRKSKICYKINNNFQKKDPSAIIFKWKGKEKTGSMKDILRTLFLFL